MLRAGVRWGVCKRFRLKWAEAGPDGTTGPRWVVSQAFITSEPASHTLTSTIFHMLRERDRKTVKKKWWWNKLLCLLFIALDLLAQRSRRFIYLFNLRFIFQFFRHLRKIATPFFSLHWSSARNMPWNIQLCEWHASSIFHMLHLINHVEKLTYFKVPILFPSSLNTVTLAGFLWYLCCVTPGYSNKKLVLTHHIWTPLKDHLKGIK